MAKQIEDPLPEDGQRALAGLVNMTSFDVNSVIHNKTAGYVYRWINQKEMRVDHVRSLGWEVVNQTNDPHVKGGHWHVTGLWKSGDRILMRCKEESFYARKEKQRNRFSALLEAQAKETLELDAEKLSRAISRPGRVHNVRTEYEVEEE